MSPRTTAFIATVAFAGILFAFFEFVSQTPQTPRQKFSLFDDENETKLTAFKIKRKNTPSSLADAPTAPTKAFVRLEDSKAPKAMQNLAIKQAAAPKAPAKSKKVQKTTAHHYATRKKIIMPDIPSSQNRRNSFGNENDRHADTQGNVAAMAQKDVQNKAATEATAKKDRKDAEDEMKSWRAKEWAQFILENRTTKSLQDFLKHVSPRSNNGEASKFYATIDLLRAESEKDSFAFKSVITLLGSTVDLIPTFATLVDMLGETQTEKQQAVEKVLSIYSTKFEYMHFLGNVLLRSSVREPKVLAMTDMEKLFTLYKELDSAAGADAKKIEEVRLIRARYFMPALTPLNAVAQSKDPELAQRAADLVALITEQQVPNPVASN